ncbi:20568_t:CDS:1 [Funneliformis geosporum]|uniref:15746_t:CDS:1 n=1 Tax=Funneliformis geosporum TaxID=1117311 RepID=A0A9W4SY10_9GLOM|nr:15746_t:CDS:1 [Funneliformis geosporum]CAI2186008.1 20568_t:CDS:1 [Funneliformis geosporum]
MESTPKISNKIIISETDQIMQPSTDSKYNNGKVNIMSQDFNPYLEYFTGSPQTKPDAYEFDEWFTSDLSSYLKEDFIFPAEGPNYDVSPLLESSMTTPSLILDNSHELDDSPLFSSIPASFSASPSLEPAFGFFPDLTNPNVAVSPTRSLLRQLSITPSVTIPVDDSSPLTTISGGSGLSSSLNIPWSSDMTSPNILQSSSSESPSLLSTISNANVSPKSSSIIASPSIMSSTSASSTPLINNQNSTRGRKRSICEVENNSPHLVDDLAMKRAKNTDAARRSRLRKVMKMESLEKQVAEFKIENNELQTRIAVLESEKKGLEDKNAEKDARVKMLEQQLAEAHERLIKRT